MSSLFFEDDGRTPNNRLPVLIHHDIGQRANRAETLEAGFADHDWLPQWRGGVFDYHHYHSTAHEALGVASGQATLIIGGEQGQTLTVRAGDVLILPAGTGHCCQASSPDFCLIGAYPANQANWDLCRPGIDDIDAARRRIASVPRPTQDPVTGHRAGLIEQWSERG